MENHFYMTLFSNASQKTYPSNTHSVFTTQLARPIDLGSIGDWEVGVCEFSCPPPRSGNVRTATTTVGDKNVLIYCDLIAPQFVGASQNRCLRTFIHPSEYCDHSFKNVYYVPVERRSFHDITIAMKKLDGTDIVYKRDDVPVKVVLHFRRSPYKNPTSFRA